MTILEGKAKKTVSGSIHVMHHLVDEQRLLPQLRLLLGNHASGWVWRTVHPFLNCLDQREIRPKS